MDTQIVDTNLYCFCVDSRISGGVSKKSFSLLYYFVKSRPISLNSRVHLIQKRLLWALVIGHWQAIVWRSVKQSISLFSYAQTPKAKLPMPNCQSNFIELGVLPP